MARRAPMPLRLLAAAYGAVAGARRRSFERHPERRRHLRQPVVSVGNLSVGGSGKTPAVAHIARLLMATGERPAILTRGYGRRDRTNGVVVVSDGWRIRADLARAGDEPLMLARALPGVAVFVCADRYQAGRLAEDRFGCTVHLLDDGFQHVRLARDVDIVMVGVGDFDDSVMPAGRLREKPSALARADALVWEKGAGARSEGPGGTSPRSTFVATASVAESEIPPDPFLAVAGIARPQRFFDALAGAGARMVGQMAFRDHQCFTRDHLERMGRAARQAGAGRLVTTEKDYVRLLPLRPFPMPIDVVHLEFAIEPAAAFRDWLLARLAARRAGAAVPEAQA